MRSLFAKQIYVTTDATGAGEAVEHYVDSPYLLYAVEVDPGGLDAGFDLTLAAVSPLSGAEYGLLALANVAASGLYYPRADECDAQGVLGAVCALPLVLGALKLTVADGGDTKKGGCVLYLMEV